MRSVLCDDGAVLLRPSRSQSYIQYSLVYADQKHIQGHCYCWTVYRQQWRRQEHRVDKQQTGLDRESFFFLAEKPFFMFECVFTFAIPLLYVSPFFHLLCCDGYSSLLDAGTVCSLLSLTIYGSARSVFLYTHMHRPYMRLHHCPQT